MPAHPAEQPTIVITGASTGIGAACALALDRKGYRVFAGVRTEAAGQRLQSLASAHLIPLRLDVTDAAAIAAAAKQVEEVVGEAGLAGLVNNAGIAVAGPLEIVPIEYVRQQFEVNVIGAVAVTQALLPLLRRARGRIVNMSSISGRVVVPYIGLYAASKHALEAISDALRVELRTWGIEVALIEPGSIATPIWEKSLAAADRISASVPSEGYKLYEADLEALRATTEKIAARAAPVEIVVRAVLHALTARRPKTRYPLTWETRLAVRVRRWLPDRLWDRIIKRQIGQS